MSVAGIATTTAGNAAVLLDSDRQQALLIFVGDSEALSIELRLHHQAFPRPLTHDLLESALERLGAEVDSVRVDRLVNTTFHGTVVLNDGTRKIELDARSSDAIALALGNGAPIFVAREVLDRAAVDFGSLKDLPMRDAGPVAAPAERKSIEL
jgi:bifunctional DNase/RNase